MTRPGENCLITLTWHLAFTSGPHVDSNLVYWENTMGIIRFLHYLRADLMYYSRNCIVGISKSTFGVECLYHAASL